MSKPFKEYMGDQMIGHKLHFQCDCMMQLNVYGTIVDYSIIKNELVFSVDVNGKIIQIGENHPNLYIKKE